MTGSGLDHLRGLTELRELNLHGMRMRDDDLMRLVPLVGLRSLQLTVRGVTWDGVGRLQRVLPTVMVGYSYGGR